VFASYLTGQFVMLFWVECVFRNIFHSLL